ncbi:HEAT repeat domain-containing protein [Candidatus Desantisbacteria bacterium]|nr:HEAT repeat domain-containing protein [Candidatus Desantisbacteria bacterium]
MKKISFAVIIIVILYSFSVFSGDLPIDIMLLPEAARSTNYLSKLFAIDLLGDVADDSYRNFFILALNNEKDTWIRYYAALALSNLKEDSQIIFELKKILTDKEYEPWLRRKIAEILYNKTGEKYRYRDEKDTIILYTPETRKINKDKNNKTAKSKK